MEAVMKKALPYLIKFLAVAVFLLGGANGAKSEEFYKGKTIRFIVGYAPGGGYDIYARVIARHFGKHVPGNPTAFVENMPGAGSLTAANHLYSVAEPDGLIVGVWDSGKVLSQALGLKGIDFDGRKFGWIGAPAKGSPSCTVMAFTGLKTLDDVLNSKEPIKVGATAPGSMSADLPVILNRTIGTKFRPIVGYKGGGQLNLAMRSRETQGLCLGWESMRATRRNLLDATGDDKLIPIIIHDRWQDPEVRDLPLIPEVIKKKSGEEGFALYEAWALQMEFQRPLTVPPGTPKDRIGILRKALAATMRDPEFLAEAKKSELTLQYVSGEEIEKYVGKLLSTSVKVKKELQTILKVK
jgi:tripartite-type tricarboxylate transporter receptor subunit TctC